MKDFMQYKGYYGSVRFDSDAFLFHGKIEFIRALVSYEATNAKALYKAFQNAIDDYLDLCKRKEIQPETPFKGSLNIRLGADLHRRIAIAAEQKHLSINKFIAEALDKVVN